MDQGDPARDADLALRELRRSYHDRIAELREHSLVILRHAGDGTAAAIHALVGEEGSSGPALIREGAEMEALAASVDAEVVSLLALESPVARDLRVILASRDVTQLGLLCVGLCVTLAGRLERAARALTPELRRLVGEVGRATEGLMRGAESAWAALDTELAGRVAAAAPEMRDRQNEFISALIALGGVPMDSALDLAMVARAIERLGDHSVEIADRVLFAVQGTPAPLSGA